MSPIIVLFLMAASVIGLFLFSGAAIWYAGRLPTRDDLAMARNLPRTANGQNG
ncbi:hypothetical protein [Salipiger sp.]|uniref:hypothetical protein n=1 Tax=Salipiger sp. TaxID=2078585 RepID=UPI003A980365